MANPAWYNDNQFRDYPFLTRVEPLAETTGFSSSASTAGQISELGSAVVVDFGAIMEIDANYTEEEGHTVYLHSISRAGDTFYLRFRTTAPDASNHEVVFAREATDAEFRIEWEDASTIAGETAEPLACPLQPKWKAFLVTGDLTWLVDVLNDGDTIVYYAGLWQIEQARIQSLMDSYLRAVTLANKPRVVTEPPDGCSYSSEGSIAVDAAIINARCLTGNLRWKEGYNCTIRQDNNNNAIIIGAGVGVGEGEPCDEIPIYEGEAPQNGSPFLSGGPGCSEIIKSINGVTGKDINLVAGPGFRVRAATNVTNRLVIDKALDDFALCLEDPTGSESSLSLSQGSSNSSSAGSV